MKQKNKYQIELPPEVVESMSLEPGQEVRISVKDDVATIEPVSQIREAVQRQVQLWSIVTAIVTAIVFFIVGTVQQAKQIPISGDNSIATWLIIANAVVGTLVFTAFFIKSRRSKSGAAPERIYWRNFPVIVVAFWLILGLALIGISWLMGQVFTDVSFDLMTSSFIFLIFCYMTNYLMALAAINLNSQMLTTLFTVTIVGGMFISMATNGANHWWQYNLSFLGTSVAKNSWQFNFTLIFSALIMVALIDYLFVSLQQVYPKNWRLTTLRWLLTFAAINLGAVGVFPNNANFHILHDQIAGFMVYSILILIIGIRWLLPNVSREFLIASYIIGAFLFVCEIAFQVIGYLSLTAFEIIAFVAAFGWVILLFQKIRELIDGREVIVETPLKVELIKVNEK
ncbi:AbrB/MazE/SpoVT family DNA-binding domain-containing protein [Lapidilactobacillus bayanensis]|uniref:AbrB/MazE/SpoVT family DNA-binding domain-containing protein n=1 Tax=Lapidilactobacillus bayanensis TaxID=2485998 RepID=UPI001CDD3173|nr:AbrB/MazE/SpoVT family DNA-binding domain-containing protein [Lapidilactobacillus bayanensis]